MLERSLTVTPSFAAEDGQSAVLQRVKHTEQTTCAARPSAPGLSRARRRSSSTTSSPTSVPPPEPRPSIVSLAGIKVLVVDDEDDARDLLQTALTDAHAEVLLAASAAEALALLQSEVKSLVANAVPVSERRAGGGGERRRQSARRSRYPRRP